VIAIAITLLVIEIGVPHVENSDGLGAALAALWPSYLGYLISFVTIGIMWPTITTSSSTSPGLIITSC